MNSNKVAIFSDLHLGIHQNSPFWHDVTLKWVEVFCIEMEKRQIDTVFFLGDFFHDRAEISVSTLHVAYQLLKKLNNFNIHMIIGNHDCHMKSNSELILLIYFAAGRI